MSKNLEAKNEVYKGIVRTPFSILFGGPVGFITNIAYTIYKAKNEIKQENSHKEYINSLYQKTNSYHEIFNEKKENDLINKSKSKTDTEYIIECFKDACVPCSHHYLIDSLHKDKLFHGNGKVKFKLITKKDPVHPLFFDGYVLDVINFRKKYDTDFDNNNVKMKLLLRKSGPKFAYINNDNKIVCCMIESHFEEIQKIIEMRG